MLGVEIPAGGSDSQDLNRTIDHLIRGRGPLARRGDGDGRAAGRQRDPLAAADLHPFYMYMREAMGPFAQGPVALIARHDSECVFSADALGLRPLWRLETPDDYIFSSEPGVVSVHDMVSEPLPLGPGEKFLVTIDAGKRRSRLWEHAEMQREVARRWLERTGAEAAAGYDRALQTGGPLEGTDIPGYTSAGPAEPVKAEERVLAGFGWQRDDVKLCQQMASNGAEPIGSLGYDGPLAALSPERQNLADYFKETVAVVTNPAIDREREMEHFSTRAVFGRRPVAARPGDRHAHRRDLVPGHPRRPPRDGAALGLDLPRDRARAPDLADGGPLGAVPRPRRGDRHRPARVRDDGGGDRAPQAGGGEAGPRRSRAGRAHRPHRLRRRAPLPRPAPGDLGDRPGAEALQGRGGRAEPAPALLDRAALGRDPQRPRRRRSPSASAPTASTRT